MARILQFERRSLQSLEEANAEDDQRLLDMERAAELERLAYDAEYPDAEYPDVAEVD